MNTKEEIINEQQNDDDKDEPMFSNNINDIVEGINFFNNDESIGTGIISTPAIDYKNYTNVNQLNHRGIYQPKNNLIYIYFGCFTKIFPIIFIIFGLAFASPFFFTSGFISYFTLVLGIIFLLVGILIMIKGYYKISFLMRDNNLIIIQKALLCKKTNIYNPGDLEYIELKYNFIVENIDKGIRPMHRYKLDIIKSNQNSESVFDVGQNKPIFTMEEIGYFNYIINEYIKNKMTINNNLV